MCKITIYLKQNCRGVHNTKLLTFCTQTDTNTDRQADFSIPPKTFVLQEHD